MTSSTQPTVCSGSWRASPTTRPAASFQVQGTEPEPFIEFLMENTPTGHVSAAPETWPVITEPATLEASDASRRYTWTVTDREGKAVVVQDSGSWVFMLDPEVLFKAMGAGVYTITLADKDDPEVTPATLNVRVPMRIVTGVHDADQGIYSSDQGTDVFRVLGGPESESYLFYVLNANDMDEDPVTEADCGVFETEAPELSGRENVFTFTHPIPEEIGFKVWVVLDPASEDPDVLRLIEAALDDVWTDVFTVVPESR